jgi:hypothetical protein
VQIVSKTLLAYWKLLSEMSAAGTSSTSTAGGIQARVGILSNYFENHPRKNNKAWWTMHIETGRKAQLDIQETISERTNFSADNQ